MARGDDIDATPDLAGSTTDGAESKPSQSDGWRPPQAGDAPTRLGRYVLLREIGRGAIGVVHAAYHEGLDRRVAIKLLNRQRAGRVDLEARLRREARALAKLSHPNVVQVYDVGEHEGRVFVAMEFVEGETLTDWVRREQRREAIVAMFVAAGRGLAAAHEAGVIHRDFKPDNVLVGKDGRPRVLDFGLARPFDASSDRSTASFAGPAPNQRATGERPAPGGPSKSSSASATGQRRLPHDIDPHDVDTSDEPPELAATDVSEPGGSFEPGGGTFAADALLTRTGALVGTPAYMSPEQFLAQAVDHRSDQFSFCVALHEALYGVRPFLGRSALELAHEVRQGRVVTPPTGREVPGWLRAVLLRGLAPEPDERWPSMDALLDALEPRQARPRRRAWLLVGALVGVGVGVGVAALSPERTRACPSVALEQALIWDAGTLVRLDRAFAAIDLPYAEATHQRVVVALSDWTARWAVERRELCEAGQRRELSSELLDLRQACLDRSRRALTSLTTQLGDADATVAENAVEAVAALPDPDRCADLDALLDDAERPPAQLVEPVQELRAELFELDTMLATGRWHAGIPLAERLLGQAAALGFDPLEVEARLRVGQFQARLGRTEDALATLQDALDDALRYGHDRLAPDIATELVSLSIYDRPDPARARVWARSAIAGLDRIGERGVARARGLWMLGNLDRIDGDLQQAEQHLGEALQIYTTLAHPDRGAVLNDLGNVLDARGDRVGAREIYVRARTLVREAFGDGHPRVAHAEFNLARLALADGRLEQARAHLDAALAIYTRALGRSCREVGDVELARASVELQDGEFGAARAHAEQARRVLDQALGHDNVDRAEPQLTLGHIALLEGAPREAAEHYRLALTIQRAALPDGHIALATTHTNLGIALLGSGEPGSAVPELERAVALLEAADDVDPSELRIAQATLGEALLGRARSDDPRRAADLLARVREGCGTDTPADQRASVLAIEARALTALGDLEPARRRAREALELIAATPELGDDPAFDAAALDLLRGIAGP